MDSADYQVRDSVGEAMLESEFDRGLEVDADEVLEIDLDDVLEAAAADGLEVVIEDAVEVEPESVDGIPARADHGLPVSAALRGLARVRWVASPGVQAAAVAATGFVAGAATLALLHRYGARRLASQVEALGDGVQLRSRAERGFPSRPDPAYFVHVQVLTLRAPE